jgi:multicomponent Na+:H+ antiporter subunit D
MSHDSMTALMNSLVPLVVLLPLLGAAGALVAGRRPRLQVTFSITVLSLVVLTSATLVILADQTGGHAVQVGGWPAPFGIVLVVDRLSALMLLISSIVLLCVLVFSVGQGMADGDRETPVSIYHPSYLILAAGVFNAFVAGDLFNLYVSFEILLVASYVLLTLGGTQARIKAGITYIIVSLVSSMLFLASIAMIYAATGTVNIAQLSLRLGELPADIQLVLQIMLLVAFGIKAAVFPLSFWLPDSYPTAPAPVTAVFAGLTLVIGILGAVAQSDIKRMLSFTLVSHIGYMVFGIAIGTVAGMAATIYYVIHHITVQTTLFLATGLVERQGGTTALNRLGGLLKASPVIAVLFFVPALNLGGIPPFSGFIGKLGLFIAGAEAPSPLIWALIGAGAVTSLLTLYALMRAWSLAFWRPKREAHEEESPALDRIEENHDDSVEVQETKASPRVMIGATTAMVVVSIALTVFAGPLYSMATRAAENLEHPDDYVSLVFPEGVS